MRSGFDLEMLDAVAARVNVPIIASGGAGKKEDFLELFHHKGINAGLAAGIFHQKLLTIREDVYKRQELLRIHGAGHRYHQAERLH